jgi:uncharacterized protein YrzB (UPF0473 family)
MKETFKIKNHVEFNRKYIFWLLTGAVIELESEFYLLPIKDQNQRKMKDGFDDVKNELKNKLDHSEEFKDKFSTAKN